MAGPLDGEIGAGPLISAVIPTLDERDGLTATLDHVATLGGHWEVVVADNGSTDGTPELAATHPAGVRVVVTPAGGRAAALNAGAEAARGDLLVFLHADSRLPGDAHSSLVAAAGDPAVVGGNFALRFDGDDRFSRMLSGTYALQRRLGFYYGDSSVWVRREAFRRLGGFRPLPIMDDYDFVRRLERLGPTACLPGPALTSSRRWRQLGVVRTVLSWVVIRWLFVAGVAPERLAGLYRRVR